MRKNSHNTKLMKKADARFAPYRDHAIAALKDDKLSTVEIQERYCATLRHMKELAEELGIDLRKRGLIVSANKRRKDKAAVVNMKMLKQHLDDLDVTYRMITKAHSITYQDLRELCKELGVDYDQRKRRSEVHIKSRNTGRVKGDDLVFRMEMIQHSLSGDGMSLEWLRKPWVQPVQTGGNAA